MKPGDPDDRELMSEVSAGDFEAFGQLYDRFCNRAYGVAYSVCRDEGHAQDAVQEAFLTLWKNRAAYHAEKGAVAGWLLTVVRYRAIDVARRNGNHLAHWASDAGLNERPAGDDVNATVLARDAANHLRASLDRLPNEQQQVITLAYFGQLSHTEIATQLRLAPGTVKGRMRLGMHKLRASMDQAAA
jgi:RNA polymerase sigma-70 factor, ECF subfamily